jgi:hypothetical protein
MNVVAPLAFTLEIWRRLPEGTLWLLLPVIYFGLILLIPVLELIVIGNFPPRLEKDVD